MQPLVGVLSDRCKSSLGRRRPFMLLGGLSTALSQLVFIRAGAIANLITRGNPSSSTARVIALVTFWILDISINLIQGPLRALLTDTVPSAQLPMGNSFFAVANGLGKVIGYGMGAFTSDFTLIYSVSAGLVCFFTLVTCLLAREKQQGPREGPSDVESQDESSSEERSALQTGFHIVKQSFKGIHTMPLSVRRAFAVQFFSYFAFMCVFIYGADWIAKNIAGGNAEAPVASREHKLFDQGIRAANLGFLVMGGISIVLGPILPIIVSSLGVKPVWLFTQVIFTLSLFTTPLISSINGAIAVFAMLAIPLAAAFTIPWAIVTLTLRNTLQRERGLYTATFNLSQALPGIIVSLIAGKVVRIFAGDLSAVLALGGLAAFISAVFTFFLEVPDAFYNNETNVKPQKKIQTTAEEGNEVDSSESDET